MSCWNYSGTEALLPLLRHQWVTHSNTADDLTLLRQWRVIATTPGYQWLFIVTLLRLYRWVLDTTPSRVPFNFEQLYNNNNNDNNNSNKTYTHNLYSRKTYYIWIICIPVHWRCGTASTVTSQVWRAGPSATVCSPRLGQWSWRGSRERSGGCRCPAVLQVLAGEGCRTGSKTAPRIRVRQSTSTARFVLLSCLSSVARAVTPLMTL